MKPLRSFLALGITAALIGACSDSSGPGNSPAMLTITDGNTQTGAAGEVLPIPLAVKVVNAEGIPLRGVTVNWTVTAGGGTVTPKGPTTVLGIATADLKLGNAIGPNSVQASTGTTAAPVTFVAAGVAGAPALVKISRDSLVTRGMGDTLTLTANVTDKYANAVAGATIQWSSSDTTVVRIVSSGLLTIRGRGNATISARSGTATGTMTVRVIPVARVIATPDTVRLHSINQTYQLTVSAFDAGNVSMAPFVASFQSLTPTVVSTQSNGAVKAVANGTGLVVVDVEGKKDTVVVNVTQVAKTAGVSPALVNLPVTLTTQLTGLALDSLGTAISGVTFSFTSNDTSVATVSATGLVTGVRTGSTKINAIAGGSITGTAEINITALLSGVNAGWQHTCGLATTGPAIVNRAYCWGLQGGDFRLGNDLGGSVNLPTAVNGALSYADVDGGGFHTCARLSTGAAYCWGDNNFGQLGNGATTTSPDPVAVSGPNFSVISSGWLHSCGIGAADQKVYCWGKSANGELGTAAPPAVCNGSPCAMSPVAVTGAITFTRVSAGLDHTCAIETPSGKAWCWGANVYGQLGTGDNTGSNVPVLVNTAATFTDIAAGDYFTCATTSDARIMCWGLNSGYQLGVGSTTNSNVPIAVGAPTGFVQVAAGGMHACARSSANAIYCWGTNTYGQLGNNSTVPSVMAAVVPSTLEFTSVTTGHDHTCAASSGGIMYCWGRNTDGQLGVGDASNRLVPTQVH